MAQGGSQRSAAAQWTPAKGLSRLALHLAVRSSAALLVWTPAMIGLLAMSQPDVQSSLVRYVSLLGGIIGLGIGWLISCRASDAAGMSGIIVTVLCAAAGAGVIVTGAGIAASLGGSMVWGGTLPIWVAERHALMTVVAVVAVVGQAVYQLLTE